MDPNAADELGRPPVSGMVDPPLASTVRRPSAWVRATRSHHPDPFQAWKHGSLFESTRTASHDLVVETQGR